MRDDGLLREIMPLLLASGLISEGDAASASAGLAVAVLAGDGSSRQFIRIHTGNRPICLAVLPPAQEPRNLAEARATWRIGRHLMTRGIPVPALYGWQEESGAILFEDLGDTRLHERVLSTDFSNPAARQGLISLYQEAVEQLVAMQIDGAEGFDAGWCWDSPRYDRQLMLERESGYFLRAFWQEMLGYPIPVGIEEDFRFIADQAAEAPGHFFLHRDFQSRNIMIKDGHIRIIDFQGGRRGPLAYDLASLLIDPYAALPEAIQRHLLQFYQEQLARRLQFDTGAFSRQYSLLALQRNLQIIGAFAFLSRSRGKAFFADYIRPALVMLQSRLLEPVFTGRTALRRTVEQALEELS